MNPPEALWLVVCGCRVLRGAGLPSRSESKHLLGAFRIPGLGLRVGFRV